jgi:hypothetical protein
MSFGRDKTSYLSEEEIIEKPLIELYQLRGYDWSHKKNLAKLIELHPEMASEERLAELKLTTEEHERIDKEIRTRERLIE